MPRPEIKCWGVYSITNGADGVRYIGASSDPETRWKTHRNLLGRGGHFNVKLQAAWVAGNPEDFTFLVLVGNLDEVDARALEAKLIREGQERGDVYNILSGSDGGDVLTHHPNRSDIIRRRVATQLRILAAMSQPERNERYGRPGPLNPMYGRSHSPEARESMGRAAIGNKHCLGLMRSAEQRESLSRTAKLRVGEKNPFFGRRHSDETKRIIADRNRGNLPPNTRPVRVGDVVHPSLSAAARSLGFTPNAILYRIRSPKWPDHLYEPEKCLTTIESPPTAE